MKFKAFLIPWAGCSERAFGIHCILVEYLAMYSAEYIAEILEKLTFPNDWTIIDYADYLFDCYADSTKWFLYREMRDKKYAIMYRDTIEIMAEP